MPAPAGEKRRVVIVGAGFGGLSLAKGLARSAYDVTLIDRHNYHLFQPLLYQVATAALSPADIAAPDPRHPARPGQCHRRARRRVGHRCRRRSR